MALPIYNREGNQSNTTTPLKSGGLPIFNREKISPSGSFDLMSNLDQNKLTNIKPELTPAEPLVSTKINVATPVNPLKTGGVTTKALPDYTTPNINPFKEIAMAVPEIVQSIYNQEFNPDQAQLDYESQAYPNTGAYNAVPNFLGKAVTRFFNPMLRPLSDDISQIIQAGNSQKYNLTVDDVKNLPVMQKSWQQITGDTAQAVFTAYFPSVFGQEAASAVNLSAKSAFLQGARHTAPVALSFGISQAMSSGSKDPAEIMAIISKTTFGLTLFGALTSSIFPFARETKDKIKEMISKDTGLTPKEIDLAMEKIAPKKEINIEEKPTEIKPIEIKEITKEPISKGETLTETKPVETETVLRNNISDETFRITEQGDTTTTVESLKTGEVLNLDNNAIAGKFTEEVKPKVVTSVISEGQRLIEEAKNFQTLEDFKNMLTENLDRTGTNLLNNRNLAFHVSEKPNLKVIEGSKSKGGTTFAFSSPSADRPGTVYMIDLRQLPKESIKIDGGQIRITGNIPETAFINLGTKGTTPMDVAKAIFNKSQEKPSQTQQVKQAIKGEAKTIKQIAEETKIKEPNIRRILGVGAKEGVFTRVDKGVYVLSKDGVDMAWVEAGNSLDVLPRLVNEGKKFDMIYSDLPYESAGNTGGNRPLGYVAITPDVYKGVVNNYVKLLKDDNSPIIHIMSTGKSAASMAKKYNEAIASNPDLKLVAVGSYTKLRKSGAVANMGKYEMPPEAVLIYNKSGNLPENLPKSFEVRAIDPRYLDRKNNYKTQKAVELVDKLIDYTTKPGNHILDPFAGSGIMPAEAIAKGRKATAIEINKDVVESRIKPKIEEALKKTQAPSGLVSVEPNIIGEKRPIVKEPVKPVVEPIKEIPLDQAQSRVYDRLRAEQPDMLKEDASYSVKNLKEEAAKAVELIATDKQKAFDIAMGSEKSPDVLSTSVNIALSEKALEEGNYTLYNTLVKNRSFEQTRRGQEIVAEKGSITDNSTTRYVKELISAKLSEVGKNYTEGLKESVSKKSSAKERGLKKIKDEVKKAKEKISKTKELDLAEAQSIIDKLTCK